MVDTFDGMARRVREFKEDLDDELDDATESGIDTLQSELRLNLQAQDSVARGVLNYQIDDDRGATTPYIAAKHRILMPDWAKFLEHGTGPRGGMDSGPTTRYFKKPDPGPPLTPILSWVIAKNISPYGGPEDPDYEDQVELAEDIQDSIGREGTYPHPFIRPAWYGPRGYRQIIKRNELALKRTLRRI
jgi:hypothetical protein